MNHEARSDRTARLLTRRLDELAVAFDRAGGPPEPVARLLELASVATMNAVSLELLSAERASGIWDAAVERHPALRLTRLAA